MLTVINGGYKPPINKSELWANVFGRKLSELHESPDDKDITKQTIFYGVRYINSLNLNTTDHDPEVVFRLASFLQRVIGRLTPRELLTVFPIAKTYNGERFECKDYHYTMNYIQTLGMDTVIGEKADELLWEWLNKHTQIFVVQMLSAMDKIRRQQGKQSMIQEFFGDKITTYRKVSDTKGREFMIDTTTGERHKVVKRMPRYLRLVKEDKNGRSF